MRRKGNARSAASFSRDASSGGPRILFVGLSQSTHTHSWMDLLQGADFDVRLFALPEGCPPQNWNVRTYVTTPHLPEGLDPEFREALYWTPEEARARQRGFRYLVQRAVRKATLTMDRFLDMIPPLVGGFRPARADSPEEWLARIVEDWRPDVIHTLGLDPAGLFYRKVRSEFHLEGIGRWVLQLRGGSDLALSRFDPAMAPEISSALRQCDQLLSDNLMNLEYARQMGVLEEQFAPIVPVPGTGGIDVDALALSWQGSPSQRRVILWPKAYDSPWSLALPVFEAIRLAWDRIQPAEIWMLAMNPGARMWYWNLPEETRGHCHIADRLPRDQVLKLMASARVMLAPSLVDGTPNTMFEAMAAGALPILSPLDTIAAVVRHEENVLFARNLYPEEIAEALVRAMADDSLVDDAATRNGVLVRKLADRAAIRERVRAYYRDLSR